MILFKKKIIKYLICYLLVFLFPLMYMPEPLWLLAQEEEGEMLLQHEPISVLDFNGSGDTSSATSPSPWNSTMGRPCYFPKPAIS